MAEIEVQTLPRRYPAVFYDGTLECAKALPAWVNASISYERPRKSKRYPGAGAQPGTTTHWVTHPVFGRPVSIKPNTWLIKKGSGAVEHRSKTAFTASYVEVGSATQPYQDRVVAWAQECFAEERNRDVVHRALRFIEEGHELVQAVGLSFEDALMSLCEVYEREPGNVPQEIGGMLTTAAVLAWATGHDMAACGENELARIWTKVDKIRQRDLDKPQVAQRHPDGILVRVKPHAAVQITGDDGGYLTGRCIVCGATGWCNFDTNEKATPPRPAAVGSLGLDWEGGVASLGSGVDSSNLLIHEPGCTVGRYVHERRNPKRGPPVPLDNLSETDYFRPEKP